MEHWTKPVVGVLGGLGPAATVTFLDLLVRLTEADKDQDHVDAVVLQHSSVPDRTQAILHGAPSPGPVLARDAQLLEQMGVDFVVLPCNSAHAFIDEIAEGLSVDVLSIVGLSAGQAVETAASRADDPGPHTIGVFATEGTIAAQTYEKAVRERGARAWIPPGDMQADLTTIIYDQVKGGRPVDVELLTRLVDRALAEGCDAVLFGCTELSIVYAEVEDLSERWEVVDSLETLAVATIERAGRHVRVWD